MVNPSKQSRFSQGRDDRKDRRGDRNRGPDKLKRNERDAEQDDKEQKGKAEHEAHENISEDAANASEDKKFTGRCRLFVGNLPPDTTEKEFVEMFKPHGECKEAFLNAHRSFGFIRMDIRENALRAKKALDGIDLRGRPIRVRFAAHTAAIRVKYLHPFVSNELLADAFSMFGEIERAVVSIDEKGKPNGEGIVEFARKPGAMQALKRVNEGVFLLGSSPRPVVCELVEHKDEEDGLPEVFMNKNNEFYNEREAPPRFPPPSSFEHNFGKKWKELYLQYDQRKHQLQMEFEDAVQKMELDESTALMEHQAQMLREDLARRQEELRRIEEQTQLEIQKKLDLRRNQEEAKRHMEEERRREEEARMFMQQELAMRQMQADERRGSFGNQRGNAPPMQPPPAPPAGLAGPRGRNEMMQNRGMMQGMGMQQGMNQQGMNQQMQGMRGRKSDADYRQSRFDQPPQHSRFDQPPHSQNSRFDQPPQNFQGNQQQMGSHQQMMQGGQGNMGGQPGGNMGNGGNQGSNQGNMGGNQHGGHGNQQMMRERHMNDPEQEMGEEGAREEYYDKKRARRF